MTSSARVGSFETACPAYRLCPKGDIARDSVAQGEAAEGGPGARCPAVFISRVKDK